MKYKRVVIYLEDKCHVQLRTTLTAKKKTVSQWAREKALEELAK